MEPVFLCNHAGGAVRPGIGTTVWFTIGSILDIRRLFRDLEARKRDALDNGMVDGHVSLADKAAFAEKGNR